MPTLYKPSLSQRIRGTFSSTYRQKLKAKEEEAQQRLAKHVAKENEQLAKYIVSLSARSSIKVGTRKHSKGGSKHTRCTRRHKK